MVFGVLAGMLASVFGLSAIPTARAAGTCATTETHFVAHEDDDLLFLNPDIYHNIAHGDCVQAVFFTAGDAGQGSSYWLGREAGIRAAYAEMAGQANTWTQTGLSINGHTLTSFTLTANSNITLVFMRLPDANGGNGSALYNYQTLKKLWQKKISSITADDGSNTYTRSDLIATTLALMNNFQPQLIRTQDYVDPFTDGDHVDHHAAAYFTQAASKQYTTQHTMIGYLDYQIQWMPANITGSDLSAKTAAFAAYDPNDTVDGVYLPEEYVVGAETTNSAGTTELPVANAGGDQTVSSGANVTLDGTSSSDPFGNTLTYAWTQTSGPTVRLSKASSAQPTFTAPTGPATLVFQLVVNNGASNSLPGSVTVIVNAPSGSTPPTANAGANQTVASGATVTLDGSGSSDPNGKTLTYQWSQTAGTTVTLSSTTAVKPTFTAPTGPATLTFQLVVNNGTSSSTPASVTITVNASSTTESNLALQSTATASSEDTNTGQTAAKAIDGSPLGYPTDYSHEWATNGGKAGSWLKLTWTAPVTLDKVVLYDRPNQWDQVTAGTLTFSDGSTVNVGTLPNDGSPLTVTFPAKTTTTLLFTITQVSSTTSNIGLAEIEAWGVWASSTSTTARVTNTTQTTSLADVRSQRASVTA